METLVSVRSVSVRLLTALGMTVALLLVPLAPHAAHADPNGNAQYNFAVGGGEAINLLGPPAFANVGAIKFAFSAHCQVAGPVPCTADPTVVAPPPSGHALVSLIYSASSSTKYQGPVTCLNVDGNTAAFTFVDQATSQPVSVTVNDNGINAQNGSVSTLYVTFLTTPYTCDQFTNLAGGGGPVTSGNVNVNMGALIPCTPMTDNTTYMIDSSCNLYVMTPSGWQVVD